MITTPLTDALSAEMADSDGWDNATRYYRMRTHAREMERRVRLHEQLLSSNDLITKDLHAELKRDNERLDWLEERKESLHNYRLSYPSGEQWHITAKSKSATAREAIDEAMALAASSEPGSTDPSSASDPGAHPSGAPDSD